MMNAIAILLVSMLVALAGGDAAVQRPGDALPQRFTAIAVSTGGLLTAPGATQVDIAITRWSTAGETERLLSTLKAKGPEALLDAVRDARSTGTIRTPGNLAYDLRYAAQEPLEDGMRRIVLITDRPISMWEQLNRPRTIDYPFTFIELRLDRNGEGHGKLNLATRIETTRSGKAVELENYDLQPIHLNEVKPVR